MDQEQASKAVITFINVIILCALPCFLFWHGFRIRLFDRWSKQYWKQIIITLVYVAAINAELPAFLLRLSAYYAYNMQVPQALLNLTVWDRWGHALLYLGFYLLTWIETKDEMPHFVKEILS